MLPHHRNQHGIRIACGKQRQNGVGLRTRGCRRVAEFAAENEIGLAANLKLMYRRGKTENLRGRDV